MSLDSDTDYQIRGVDYRNGSAVPTIQINGELRLNNKISLISSGAEVSVSTASGKRILLPSPAVSLEKTEEIRDSHGFSVDVEVSYSTLEKIESIREDDKLTFEVDLWMSGSTRRKDEIESAHSSADYSLIPAVWTEVLGGLGYHDTRTATLNLGVSNIRVRDSLDSAHAQIERAQTKHDNGDYQGAIVGCRTAVETLRTLDEDLEGLIDDRKLDELDDILGEVEKGFMGGQAHASEKTNISPPLKRDSDLALGITKSCLRYISTVFDEEE
ncbi:hypothetical protein [Halorubrum halophilum]|uniref:hypothetical protein n=1 Tax=Halorubrum halophilum TaxID=413816 RepID=UPI0012ABF234|nr:hypothetical protein [Halorubrum halophilum]